MLTKNGKIMLRVYCNQLSNMSGVTVKDTSGVMNSIGAGYTALGRVAVGSGTGAFSTDDYTLTDANDDNLGLTLLSSEEVYNTTYANDFVATFSTTYKNNTANAITVKEIGVYMHYSSSPVSDYMITRDVGAGVQLEIQPGETATFSVTIG